MAEQDAVSFDWTVFRVWLEQPSKQQDGAPVNRDAVPALATAYQRSDGELGWVVEAALDALRGAQPPAENVPAPWTYGPGVSDVRVWTVAAPEGGADGSVVGEVTVDGVALSLGRFTERDLVPSEHDMLPGYEAAERALHELAFAVNAAAGRFRGHIAQAVAEHDDGEVVDAEIIEDPETMAYRQAAAAVDYDVNHPAHPAHW